MSVPPSELHSHPTLEGYEVLAHLGAGATGEVWSVRRGDGVRLAAKIVPAGSDQLDVEASLLSAMDHEHVVRIQDVLDLPDGRTALIMDLAEGGALADVLGERGHLSDGELVTILSPIARALHDLHGLGLVHADLSPGNILLTAAGKPLIADFGVSRLAGHVGEDTWATEAWAAPEVLLGELPTPASDAYSLGAIAWACLTGAAPEPAALRPDLADLAPWSASATRDLVLACLSHTPQARPDPGEFATLLWACAHAEPAPVKGSVGRRLGGEPQQALTRRVVPAPGSFDFLDDENHGAPARSRWRRPLLVTAVLAPAAGIGAWTLPMGPGGPALTLAGHYQPGAVTRAAGPAAPASAAHPATPATPPVRRPTLTAPTEVVTRLLQSRAGAWQEARADQLTSYVLAGSPAERKERAALQQAAAERLRYDGLRFQVRSTTVRPGSGDPHVIATIDQSAFRVGARSAVARPAKAGQQVEFTLRWTPDGWRIADWSAR